MKIASDLFRRFPNNVLFQRYAGAALMCWQNIPKRRRHSGNSGAVRTKEAGYADFAKREALFYVGLIEMDYYRYDAAINIFLPVR